MAPKASFLKNNGQNEPNAYSKGKKSSKNRNRDYFNFELSKADFIDDEEQHKSGTTLKVKPGRNQG